MALVEEGSGEAPIIEDNMYTLTVVSAVVGIREGPDKFNPEVVDAPIVHINTALEGTEDDEGNPIVLRSTMNLKFSRGGTYQPSTLFLFAQAFGVVPDVGTPFDTDWLKGKKARGMVRTETEGKWPKVIPESLIPMPKGNGRNAPSAVQEARQPSNVDDVPFDTVPALADQLAEAAALANWFEEVKGIGYTTKEILDHCKAQYDGRLPKDLTADERVALGQELLT